MESHKSAVGYKLTDEDKKEIAGYTHKGLGYRRISRLMGIKEGCVKSFLHRHRNDPAYFRTPGICPQCGNQVQSTPHKREKKFCSDKCRLKWWSSHSFLINKQSVYPFTCKQCGKEFEAYGNNHRIYCSRECYAESRRKNIPSNSPIKDSNIYTLTCEHCGRIFKSLGEPDKKYCSRACVKAGKEKADE